MLLQGFPDGFVYVYYFFSEDIVIGTDKNMGMKEFEECVNQDCSVLIDISIGARDDLGRPTTTARENKENFMGMLKSYN